MDAERLARALALAEQGRGRVSPNPMVGALIAAERAGEGRMIGEGFHARYGGLHAEREALADCRRRGEDPRGGTLYVSLEPCAHTGRQPPCVEAILEAGIARVVIASDDPSPKAAGRGPELLRQGGVAVEWAGERGEAGAELERRARALNQPFRKHATSGLPWVMLKLAISLDGRVAVPSGDSRWISGEQSRALAHRWRAELDAVAAGIGTVLADDPLLTARPPGSDTEPGPASGPEPEPQPARVVFDSHARLPGDSRLLASLDSGPVLVAVGPRAPVERVERLRELGATVFATGLPSPGSGTESSQATRPGLTPGSDRVDLREALEELGARGVTSIMLEGGPQLGGAMIAAGEVDELRVFVAPVMLGEGPAALAFPAPERVRDAIRAHPVEHEQVGDDVLIRASLRRW